MIKIKIKIIIWQLCCSFKKKRASKIHSISYNFINSLIFKIFKIKLVTIKGKGKGLVIYRQLFGTKNVEQRNGGFLSI